MTMMIREPECVVLKQRGAEHVAKLIAGMSLQEQLEFWGKRTQAMLIRQEESHQRKAGQKGNSGTPRIAPNSKESKEHKP